MDSATLSSIKYVAVQLLALSSVMWNDVAHEQPPTPLTPGLLPANVADITADLVSRFAGKAPVGPAQPPSVLPPPVSRPAGGAPSGAPTPASAQPPAAKPPVASATPAAVSVTPAVTVAPAAPAAPAHPAPTVAPAPPAPAAPARHKRDVLAAVADAVSDAVHDAAVVAADNVGDIAAVAGAAADAVSQSLATTTPGSGDEVSPVEPVAAPAIAPPRVRRSVGDAIAEVADTVGDIAGVCKGDHLPGRLCASVGRVADVVENSAQSDERAFTRALFE